VASPKRVRRTCRNETTFRSTVVRDWRGDVGGVSSAWGNSRWYQFVEHALQSGWPDLVWTRRLDPEAAHAVTGHIEFKYCSAKHASVHRVTLPMRPGQTTVLRWLAAQGVPSGILTWVAPRKQWLWVPAQPVHRWAVQVASSMGWLLWPHTWGIGKVPLPWLLPSPVRHQPCVMTRRNPHVTHLIDGAEVHPSVFAEESARQGAPLTFKDMRADDPLDTGLRRVRKALKERATRERNGTVRAVGPNPKYDAPSED
jgi:hypothetical protein